MAGIPGTATGQDGNHRGRAGRDIGGARPGFQLRAEDRREKAAAAHRGRGHGDFPFREGLTHGEISTHLQEIKRGRCLEADDHRGHRPVMGGVAEWQSRPLDPVYAVVQLVRATWLSGQDGGVRRYGGWMMVGGHGPRNNQAGVRSAVIKSLGHARTTFPLMSACRQPGSPAMTLPTSGLLGTITPVSQRGHWQGC